MKKILVALLIFLVSLGALSFLNKSSGNNTPHYSAESVESPFIEDPELEAKIAKVTIKHYVQDGVKDGEAYVRFTALLSNVDDLPFSLISSVDFEVMNNGTGQILKQNCNTLYTALLSEGQRITAESMGGDCFAHMTLKNPQNGEYKATCTISYHNSKTKTSASRVYNHSESGTK